MIASGHATNAQYPRGAVGSNRLQLTVLHLNSCSSTLPYLETISTWYCAASRNTREEDLALKSMPLDKLVELRNRIDAVLASKVAEQRRALQSELSKLGRVQPNGSRGIAARSGGVVAPKYRNPDNPAETWAGRGLKPRWMTAAMRGGGKLEDFLISAQAMPKTKGPRKAQKARK